MPHEIAIARAADALTDLHNDCMKLQNFDRSESLARLSPEEMRRRQSLDRITQEVGALSDYLQTFARTEDLEKALEAVHLLSLRSRLGVDKPPPPPEAGEPDLF